MQNFEKLITLLADNHVEFVLIGGLAAAAHGSTLSTQDIDVCIPFDEKNLSNLIKAFRDIHPIHRGNRQPFTETADVLTKFKNLYLITDLGSIDLIGYVAGVGSYNDLKDFTMKIELFGKMCLVLDIDSLIKSKKEMGRPKDKEVILQLEAIKEKLS